MKTDELKNRAADPDGVVETRHENGQLHERSNYKNGKLDGLYESWYENGQMHERVNYKEDKLDGLSETWFENGQTWRRVNWTDDELHGIREIWYSNGQMRERLNWKNSKRDGLCETWYANGQMRERSNWKNGKLDGLSEFWDENGQMKERSNWKDGERVGALPVDPTDRGTPAPRQEGHETKNNQNKENDMKITATRTTTNPAWTKTLTIKLVSTSNGYWWRGTAPDCATTKDAVIDANALRPGQTRRTGYATVDSACRQASKEGWQVIRD